MTIIVKWEIPGMIVGGAAVEPGWVGRKQGSASIGRAFTLVELLVVIGVVAILAVQLLPALARAKSRSANTYCMNYKKQLTAAVQMYAPDFGGWFPPTRMTAAQRHRGNGVGVMSMGGPRTRRRPARRHLIRIILQTLRSSRWALILGSTLA